MTSDNTKFADLSNLRETLIGDLIKKSNGGGGQPPHNGGGADPKTIYPENSKHMRERLEAMNQKLLQYNNCGVAPLFKQLIEFSILLKCHSKNFKHYKLK